MDINNNLETVHQHISKTKIEEGVFEEYFENFKLGPLALKNRFIVSPMCSYIGTDGEVTFDHLVHYQTFAEGGSGLVIVEATSVNNEGLISDNDLTLYKEEHVERMSKLTKHIQKTGAKAAIQLSHAGRKSEMKDKNPRGISDVKFQATDKEIDVLTVAELDQVVQDFINAARLAEKSGFDAIEIHAAHGYLIHQSLSPITNTRLDKYGDKTLLLLSILKGIREAITVPIIVRFSAVEYAREGYDIDYICDIINKFDEYIDIVDVSSGGESPEFNLKPYAGYQLGFAEHIKLQTKKPVIAVGLLSEPSIINYALATNKTDAIAIGRANIQNPYYINNLIAHKK